MEEAAAAAASDFDAFLSNNHHRHRGRTDTYRLSFDFASRATGE